MRGLHFVLSSGVRMAVDVWSGTRETSNCYLTRFSLVANLQERGPANFPSRHHLRSSAASPTASWYGNFKWRPRHGDGFTSTQGRCAYTHDSLPALRPHGAAGYPGGGPLPGVARHLRPRARGGGAQAGAAAGGGG